MGEEPRYRKLLVWQKAHNNALVVIDMLQDINPKYSRICDQCLGAATSIGANIAEGNNSVSFKQKESYFRIALNSAYEFDNWLQILKDSKVIALELRRLSEIEKENIAVIKILSKIIQSSPN